MKLRSNWWRSALDYSISTPSILVTSTLKRTPAPRRFVWCVQHSMRPCVTRSLRQFVAKVVAACLACTLHSSHPCLVKTANRSCKSEGCWSKSLKRLLLDWNRVWRRAFCIGCSQPLLSRPIGAIRWPGGHTYFLMRPTTGRLGIRGGAFNKNNTQPRDPCAPRQSLVGHI
jgi:hypothetical protein